jgi:hypothetical protein
VHSKVGHDAERTAEQGASAATPRAPHLPGRRGGGAYTAGPPAVGCLICRKHSAVKCEQCARHVRPSRKRAYRCR